MNILFDLDGTLLDTAPDFFYVINQLRQENNLDFLDESALPSLRKAVSHGVSGLIETGMDLKPNHPQKNILSTRFLNLYQEIAGSYTVLFPGAENLLQTLEQANIPWGIVTNKESAYTLPLLQRLDLEKRAASIVSGDTTPNPKPHPDPLFYACKTMKVSPNECIYVGDAERDIIAGKKAGMKTIVALFGYIESFDEAKRWQADHYVNHFDEIWPWLQKL